jgi:hypothetical protein
MFKSDAHEKLIEESIKMAIDGLNQRFKELRKQLQMIALEQVFPHFYVKNYEILYIIYDCHRFSFE